MMDMAERVHTYGRLYKYHDMSRLDGFIRRPMNDPLTVVIYLDFMLTTIPPLSTDITSKGSFATEPSLRIASKTSEPPDISYDSMLDVPEGVGEGVREGGGELDRSNSKSSKSGFSKSEDGSGDSGVMIIAGSANAADSSWAIFSG
jgi:hypothetical protein